MTSETDLRQKKFLELLQGSIKPLQSDVPDPNLNQPQMKRITVGEGGISGLPKPDASQGPPMPNVSALPELERVRVGESTQGMSPSQQQQTYVDLLKQASPRSQINKTPGFIEEDAPKPKGHGLLNALKNLGKGAIISTGEYARTHPGAEAGELLGAGGAGAAVGAVKPETIDWVRRQAEIGQAQGDLDRQLGTEEKQAQIGARQAEPALRGQQIANEAEYRKGQQEIQAQLERGRIDRSEAQRQMETLRSAEAERHNREMERQGQAKIDKPSAATVDNSELIGNLDKRIGEYSSKAQDLRQQADALKGTADTSYTAGQDRDRLLREASEADKEAASLRGQRDRESIKTKPPIGPTADKPETRKGTISKEQQELWLSHNPGKTVEDMKKLYPNAKMVN